MSLSVFAIFAFVAGLGAGLLMRAGTALRRVLLMGVLAGFVVLAACSGIEIIRGMRYAMMYQPDVGTAFSWSQFARSLGHIFSALSAKMWVLSVAWVATALLFGALGAWFAMLLRTRKKDIVE